MEEAVETGDIESELSRPVREVDVVPGKDADAGDEDTIESTPGELDWLTPGLFANEELRTTEVIKPEIDPLICVDTKPSGTSEGTVGDALEPGTNVVDWPILESPAPDLEVAPETAELIAEGEAPEELAKIPLLV